MMRLDVYLARALPLLSVLAALGPGNGALKMILAPGLAKKITQYGPLPEIKVPLVDYVTLMLAIVLIIAAVLELCHVRLAAPIALASIVALWVYYIPAIWDEMTGSMYWAMKLGRSMGVTWQMLTYQTLSMVCATALTYLRFGRSR